MTIRSLGNDNLLSRCVYSDILNRNFPPKKPFRPENSDCAECVTFSLPLWATDSNWKQDLFPFYMPWRHHICIDKSHYSYRDDLPENLPNNHCPRMQKVHFRWSLKRFILTRNVTRYSNEPIRYIIMIMLFTFEHCGFNVLYRWTNAGEKSISSRRFCCLSVIWRQEFPLEESYCFFLIAKLFADR